MNVHERDGKRYRDELLSDMRKRMEQKLAHQATHDLLTGLPNRSVFEDRFRQAVARARRQSGMAALLYLDLDRFKRINDTLGHLAGDTLIQFAAERLAGCLRESETLSRSGGDRFTLVLGDVGAPEDAVHVAERILETLSPPFSVKGNEVFLGASIGIALYPQDGVDLPALQRAADSALYAAKRQGGRIRLSNPEISQEANRRLGVETELHHALERDEISVHIRFGHWPRGRIGGAGALGQSEVRTSPAIRSDSDSGRERAHRADRRPRAARRLPPGQVVAGRRLWAHASGRQYFSRAIPRGAIWPKPWRPRSPRRA